LDVRSNPVSLPIGPDRVLRRSLIGGRHSVLTDESQPTCLPPLRCARERLRRRLRDLRRATRPTPGPVTAHGLGTLWPAFRSAPPTGLLCRRTLSSTSVSSIRLSAASTSLTDALGGEKKHRADRFECPGLAFETEAPLEDPPLTVRQRAKRAPDARREDRLLGPPNGSVGSPSAKRSPTSPSSSTPIVAVNPPRLSRGR
jgi:hypothetical protein